MMKPAKITMTENPATPGAFSMQCESFSAFDMLRASQCLLTAAIYAASEKGSETMQASAPGQVSPVDPNAFDPEEVPPPLLVALIALDRAVRYIDVMAQDPDAPDAKS